MKEYLNQIANIKLEGDLVDISMDIDVDHMDGNLNDAEYKVLAKAIEKKYHEIYKNRTSR